MVEIVISNLIEELLKLLARGPHPQIFGTFCQSSDLSKKLRLGAVELHTVPPKLFYAWFEQIIAMYL